MGISCHVAAIAPSLDSYRVISEGGCCMNRVINLLLLIMEYAQLQSELITVSLTTVLAAWHA